MQHQLHLASWQISDICAIWKRNWYCTKLQANLTAPYGNFTPSELPCSRGKRTGNTTICWTHMNQAAVSIFTFWAGLWVISLVISLLVLRLFLCLFQSYSGCSKVISLPISLVISLVVPKHVDGPNSDFLTPAMDDAGCVIFLWPPCMSSDVYRYYHINDSISVRCCSCCSYSDVLFQTWK